MKRVLKMMLAIGIITLLFLQQACMVKRDCRGRIKHKLPNGVWI